MNSTRSHHVRAGRLAFIFRSRPARNLPPFFHGGRILLAGLLLGLILQAAAQTPAGAGAQPPPLSTAAEVKNLPPAEARRGLPVHLHGVVTYYDPGWLLLFVQDSSGGVFLLPGPEPLGLHQGQEVDVTGVSGEGRFNAYVNGIKVKVLAQGPMPEPAAATLPQMATGEEDCQWVELEGIVRSVGEERGRFVLDLAAEGQRLNVIIPSFPQKAQYQLLGAKIKIRGVCAVTAAGNRRVIGTKLLAPNVAAIQVERPAPRDPFDLAVRPVSSLSASGPGSPEVRLVRVRGRVTASQSGRWVEMKDATGRIRAQTSMNTPLPEGVWVDIAGYPRLGRSGPALEDAIIRRIGEPSNFAPETFEVAETNGPLPRLNSAKQVHALSAAEAGRGYPVRLAGVITYYDQDRGNLFFQGMTDGIYVHVGGGQKLDIKAGQAVALYGRTAPGEYAPVIEAPRFDVLGAAPMPAPVRATMEEMLSGRLDSQWVETEGVVHSATNAAGHVLLWIFSGTFRFEVTIPGSWAQPIRSDLVDATVRLQAVCGAVYNANRQLSGMQLYMPDLTFLEVIRPPRPDVWSQAVQPARSLLQYHPSEESGHRVHVRGVVTLRQRNGSFYLQDADGGGLFVQAEAGVPLEAGEEVDAIGFPGAGDYSPVLQKSELRIRGGGRTPDPVRMTAEELLGPGHEAGTNDNRLVEIEGILIDRLESTADETLIVEDGPWIFQAVLERVGDARRVAGPRPKSGLRLTGVCSIQTDENRDPKGFRIKLRSASDITVLREPPWWTLGRTLVLLAALGLVIVGVAAWAMLLRRRVERQTRVIRQRLQHEEVLEQRFRALFEHAADAIFVHDDAGRILMVNQRACDNLRYTREELAGLRLEDIEAGAPRSAEQDSWRQMTPGQTLNIRGFHQRKDGSRFPVELRVGLFEEKDQRQFVALARDLTDRQELEEQLRQSQKMESVGLLAGGVAHDFNNLLTVIQGHASLLLEEGATPGQNLESARQISESAERAASLTRQLLTFSRRQVMQPRELDLNAVVVNFGKMLRRLVGENIDLDIYCSPDVPRFRADLGMMEQILMNLAVNARDAMPRGGRLVIRTSFLRIPPFWAQRNPEALGGPAVCLVVGDNGSGIAPEHLPRIFEPFFTTKEVGKGTGLGLATVYGIVKQHHGWIQVSSRPGAGATFQVFLPLLEQVANPAPSPEEKTAARGGAETILVVEDEDALRGLVVKTLTRLGYRVLAAASAVEALSVWNSGRREIDLLLTDVVMPGGMSGTELAAKTSAEEPALRVLFTSGYSPDIVAKNCVLDEEISFLAKPYTPDALARAVRDCLDQVLA